ncbi:MAG: hypothetical protein ACYDD1_22460 [Caulobacteraceae bacterium]
MIGMNAMPLPLERFDSPANPLAEAKRMAEAQRQHKSKERNWRATAGYQQISMYLARPTVAWLDTFVQQNLGLKTLYGDELKGRGEALEIILARYIALTENQENPAP